MAVMVATTATAIPGIMEGATKPLEKKFGMPA